MVWDRDGSLLMALYRLLNQPWFIRITALVVLVVGVAIVQRVYLVEKARLLDGQYSQILSEATAVRARLEQELNATLYLTTGLMGYVISQRGITPEQAESIFPILYGQGKHIRNIGFAPDNILQYVYPREGNEKAIGLDYQKHPDQWPDVSHAIQARRTVLSGPIDLVQGGKGIISRTPVYFENGQYWGLLSIVIDMDSLFATVGLDKPSNHGVQFALRKGNDQRMIAGDYAIFGMNPVLLPIIIPEGEWQLAALPDAGWDNIFQHLNLYKYLGFFIVMAFSLLIYTVLLEHARTKFLAMHDSLTGLPNRNLLKDRLERCIIHASRNNTHFALLYLDLDNFKPINDQYGHKMGDLLLRELAKRIQQTVRLNDTVSRVGGDEFVVVLSSINDLRDALLVTKKIEEVFAQEMVIAGVSLSVGCSIGVGVYPTDGETMDDLIRYADDSMYLVKNTGRANPKQIKLPNIG